MKQQVELAESVPLETGLGLPETRRTLDVWLEMIRSARESLDIETFYVVSRSASAFERVIGAIKEAARRRVRVRVLTDARMTGTYPKTVGELDLLDNVQTRAIAAFNARSGVLHAKYFVVDHEECFLGSQNFDWRALEHIHELGVRVRNAAVSSRLEAVFAFDWKHAAPGDPDDALRETDSLGTENGWITIGDRHDDGTKILPAGSPGDFLPNGMPREENILVDLLDEAQERIEVQLLLYSPFVEGGYYPPLDNAFRRAAGRGVSVRLIVSNWNLGEPAIHHLKSLALIPGVEIGISSIPEHSGGFIPFSRVEHCKYLRVDGRKTWIATGNWSRDYFHSSRNLGLLFEDAEIASTVSRVFENSWGSDYVAPLDPCKEYTPPVFEGPED